MVLLEAIASQQIEYGAKAERATALRETFNDIFACGVSADRPLVCALVRAHLRTGNGTAALDAVSRGKELGVTAHSEMFKEMLHACIRASSSRRAQRGAAQALLDEALALAEQHGLDMRSAADLLLKAHLACIPHAPAAVGSDMASSTVDTATIKAAAAIVQQQVPPQPPSIVQGEVAEPLDKAISLYKHAQQLDWRLKHTSRRSLLALCAQHGRLHVALNLLDELVECGEAPGLEGLNKLMAASFRVGGVEEHTVALWLAGSAETLQ